MPFACGKASTAPVLLVPLFRSCMQLPLVLDGSPQVGNWEVRASSRVWVMFLSSLCVCLYLFLFVSATPVHDVARGALQLIPLSSVLTRMMGRTPAPPPALVVYDRGDDGHRRVHGGQPPAVPRDRVLGPACAVLLLRFCPGWWGSS